MAFIIFFKSIIKEENNYWNLKLFHLILTLTTCLYSSITM